MNLQTSYLGLELKNPIVASASPLTKEIERVKRLEDCGASAVVMHSIFEEQIEHESLQLDHDLSFGSESYGESLSYLPELPHFKVGPDEHLDQIRKIKEAVDIPLIASINGATLGGWTDFAKRMEEAGADALELNSYFVSTDPELSAADLEQRYLDIISEVRKTISIPLSIKLSPFFSALPNFAKRAAEAGVSGLVLFNRFYQPDIDLEELEVVPDLDLSESSELRLPLRWVAILCERVAADLAISSGVHNEMDVLKGTMAGAKVTMMTSEIFQGGIRRITEILQRMSDWMEEHEYESIKQMQGSMCQRHVADPAAFERSNYMRVLGSFEPSGTL